MKEKGFTLVELLGVLIILVILALLVVPNVSQYFNKFREGTYESQVESIEMAAKSWSVDHGYELPTDEGLALDVSLLTLKEGGYLNLDISNPENPSESFSDYDCVKITKVNNRYTYEFAKQVNCSY